MLNETNSPPFEKLINKLQTILDHKYVQNTSEKIVELESKNIFIKIITLISMIALITVYFLYILSFILYSFGTDIWFNSTIAIFIIFVIFFILFFFLLFGMGYAINKDVTSNEKEPLKIFFESISHLLMNILFFIPAILSLSLMASILQLQFNISLLNIPKNIITNILIFFPTGISVLLLIYGALNNIIHEQKIILSIFSGIINTGTIILLFFVFSSIIEKLMRMWYKNEKDCNSEESDCGGNPNSDSSSITPTIANTNTALYKNKISIYFVTEDSDNPNNKFGIIGLIIYIVLVIATFLMHYILLYQPVTLISNIKLKGKASIYSIINKFFFPEPQTAGSKRKLKRK